MNHLDTDLIWVAAHEATGEILAAPFGSSAEINDLYPDEDHLVPRLMTRAEVRNNVRAESSKEYVDRFPACDAPTVHVPNAESVLVQVCDYCETPVKDDPCREHQPNAWAAKHGTTPSSRDAFDKLDDVDPATLTYLGMKDAPSTWQENGFLESLSRNVCSVCGVSVEDEPCSAHQPQAWFDAVGRPGARYRDADQQVLDQIERSFTDALRGGLEPEDAARLIMREAVQPALTRERRKNQHSEDPEDCGACTDCGGECAFHRGARLGSDALTAAIRHVLDDPHAAADAAERYRQLEASEQAE